MPTRPARPPQSLAAVQPLRRRRRANLRRPHQRHRLRILVIAVTVLASISAALVGATFIAYASYRTQLPDAATVAAMEPPLDSHVFDSKGNLIAVFNDNGVRHVHATLDNISQFAKLATIDVEDRHFYSEGSWDLPRLVKASWDNLRHTNSSGASTITEQLAKISFFNAPDRSLDYKIKEIVLGNELDSNFTKNQILEMYLNRVPYGNHAIGIETAAELYFFKSAKDLDLAQSAMLAGLPQSPTVYNPVLDNGANTLAKQRQKVVLAAMVSNGDITQKQADAAYAEPLTFHSWAESQPNSYPSITNYVTRWLNFNYGSTYINPGGWDIYATVDPALQKAAQTAVHNTIAVNSSLHNTHDGALVNLDPKTGKVLAMVGAWNYNDSEEGYLNMALSPRSPGSAIKLFTYTAAIASHQFTMTTPIQDTPIHIPGSAYSPQNYDRKLHGTCVVKTCLGNSLNIPAVKVEVATGIPYITSLEVAAGITSYASPYVSQGGDRPGPTDYSATLGGFPVTPLELADGAATIADLGVHHDPSPVDHIIVRGAGQTVFKLDPNATARRVVPENVAFIINQIVSNDANRVMDFGAHGPLTLPDRRVSAKTGTAEYFNDNWTIGWTPDIVTAVWVGNPSGSCLAPADRAKMQNAINRGHVLFSNMTIDFPFSPLDLAQYGLKPNPRIATSCGHLDNSDGVTGAAPIWHNDMVAATARFSASDWYAMPKDVVQVGTGDNADFFLPGSQATPGNGTCYYWGPAGTPPPPPSSPDAAPCVYTGTGPPTSTPQPGETTPQSAPGPPGHGHKPKPTPPPGG
ncbi:MAG: transglycosylase domain-containing protein [Candidatus Dormibacter sp.]